MVVEIFCPSSGSRNLDDFFASDLDSLQSIKSNQSDTQSETSYASDGEKPDVGNPDKEQWKIIKGPCDGLNTEMVPTDSKPDRKEENPGLAGLMSVYDDVVKLCLVPVNV
jgi:hypothetical protein